MSLLEHPTAQRLLADVEVSAAAVRSCCSRLEQFLQRYQPCFYRLEHHDLARVVLQGKLSKLERKTSEPIAYLAERPRKPVQHFVGAGAWDDEAVMAELRTHVAEELGDADAVLVLDSSGFAKKGTASCGVDRQWCGRLGKVDNCQVGVFLAYVTATSYAPLDRQLYLPQTWADDAERRERTHVPEHVTFQESWRIGLGLLDRSSAQVPFGWVAGDDAFGRVTALRAAVRARRWRYVFDVPCNTLIRDITAASAAGRGKWPWQRVDAWAEAQPSWRWRRVKVGDGSKGPRVVRVLETWVQAKDVDGGIGPRERLVVIRTIERAPQVWYTLSYASDAVSVDQVAWAHARRHGVEEVLQAGKGEVGLGHYEVRSWVGWHHHMTLSLLALWFLILEKERLGGKNPGVDGATTSGSICTVAAGSKAELETNCGGDQPGAPSQRRSPHLSLV